MNVLPSRPLILIGDCWRSAIECISKHLVVSQADLEHLSFVDTAEQAVAILKQRIY